MGNVFKNSNKTKEEVLLDIESVNKITTNDLFYRKTLKKLRFSLHLSFFSGIFSNKVILCEILAESVDNKERSVYISLSQYVQEYDVIKIRDAERVWDYAHHRIPP